MHLRNFRYVALAEAVSFLILIVASIVKRTADDADIGVTIMGPIHGALFVLYILFAYSLREPQNWTGKQTGLIMLGAVLPFGGFVVDRWLAQQPQPQTRS